jgi:anti-sigma factor RsiW
VERLTKVLDAHRGMGCTISSYDERAVLLARAEAAEAEVERLTADYNAAVERIHELLAEKVDREAAIQRVREVCDLEDAWWLDVGEHAGTNDRGELPFAEVYAILRALDGGPDHA